MPLEGGRPPPSGSPSPLPARGPPAPPPPPRSGGGGPEGVARGFSPGRPARGSGRLGGWGHPRRGGDGRASAPREREAQWVGRSRLRVRELIPPAALARGASSGLSLSPTGCGGGVPRRSVGRSVCSRAVPFWGVSCLLLPPRSVRGAGVQRGGLSGTRKKGVSWCGARKGTAAPEGVGRDCRSDLGVQVCVCGTERAQRRAGPALAGGLVEARGVRGAHGVCLRKGGGAKGQIEKWGKEALPSLSLSPVCLQRPPLPAVRPAPRPGSDLLACCRRFDPRWV